MKYDFTTMVDRRGLGASAVESIPGGWKIKDGFSQIPMWIADMAFGTVPTVQQRIMERLQNPTFGYFGPHNEYYESIIKWQERRNGVENLTRADIAYENGVLGCLTNAVQALALPTEPILVHAPNYTGFGVINGAGRRIVFTHLKKDETGTWRMDYEDMEKKIQENHIHLALLCSPHNPSGRVWEREELEKAMAIYEKYGCTVISDEIWSDIVMEGHKHIPTQSVSEYARNNTIAMYAPTKTFNLAGLIGAYRIVYNPALRDKLSRQSGLGHYNNMNVFTMYGTMGAYQEEGYEWVDELRHVLTENVNFAYDFINENFPGVKLSKPQGTYMLFLDCSEWCEKHNMKLEELLQKGVEVGVIWLDGRDFNGPMSIRVNVALPTKDLKEAFRRLKEYVFVE